jgi:hypothetical protein
MNKNKQVSVSLEIKSGNNKKSIQTYLSRIATIILSGICEIVLVSYGK